MQENDIILELRNVDKGFNRGTVNETILFSGFGLSVERGEFISVVGSNGSGKTTMLNIISGSTSIDGGSVLLEGRKNRQSVSESGGGNRSGHDYIRESFDRRQQRLLLRHGAGAQPEKPQAFP